MKKYYYTIEDMEGNIRHRLDKKVFAKKTAKICSNEGICYKRKLKDSSYKKFMFMW